MKPTQEIYVLNKRLKLFQIENGFKTSIDSVLLAAACPAGAGDKILDMGCGVGGAGLCVLKRVAGTALVGVDIQADHIALACENAAENGMAARAEFVSCDMRDYAEEKAFHHIICNPPYLEAGAHLRSPHTPKAKAMGHEDEDITIKTWVDAAHYNLKSKGSLSMIHRADCVDEIIQALGKRFGATEIIPLYPRAGEAAKRVIIRTIKDRRSPATLHAGLILHDTVDAHGYSAAAEKIFREMERLY